MSSPAIDPPRASVTSEGRHTDHWESDRDAVDRVRELLRCLPTGFLVFHDLELPKPSRSVVDHLVVGPRNIWAVSTHVLSEPVTFGRGRNADTLWAGRTPLRTLLEAADWEASAVSAQIGFDVEPVVCLVAPGLPEPTFDFHGIRICDPGALVHQVATSTADFVDVPHVAAAVGRAFGVHEAVGTAVPKLGSSTLPPMYRATAAGRPRRTLGARMHSIRSIPVVRAIAVLSVLAGVLMFLPTISGAWNSIAAEGADRLTDVIDDVEPSENAEPAPTAEPLPARYTLACPASGAGWLLTWEWPGPLPEGVAGYGIRTQVDDAPPIVHAVIPWSEPASPPSSMRISVSNDAMVFTDYRSHDGAVVATTVTPLELPAGSC